jgi:polysaccharide export outer membrane protein
MGVGRFFSMRLMALFCFALGMTVAGSVFAQRSGAADLPAKPAVPEQYTLAPGDVISIRVYGEDDLTREKIRLTDTTILTLPFGNLVARGLTINELQNAIADGLRGRYLVNPHVSVTIDEYRPFFIQGQVQRPGGYPYQPGLNVRKAVSIAGGFRERASMSKIYVVRENDKSNTPAKVDLNSPIGPGDTVTVEESFF